jgi:hypothetical protein
MPFVMLMFDFCDDVIWPAILLERAKEFPAFGAWVRVGMQNDSVLHLVVRERRKTAVLEMLPAIRKKYAE